MDQSPRETSSGLKLGVEVTEVDVRGYHPYLEIKEICDLVVLVVGQAHFQFPVKSELHLQIFAFN